ncbi:MAG: redox-regulated ATPase YchF [Candidatus Yanofskybacteria bacterium]|nr:redox-regulated ATPase YchF [Candidatus Yanofskybacteria bacterium]
MSLSIGIVGLPNVGKSTLFKALTNKQVDIQNYPFTTIDPNVGVVEVPDKRVDALALMSNSKKRVYATVDFIDIAGLVRGAAQGEGLGNKFLANIREVDAIAQVVRAFEDTNITHVHNRINPTEDIEIINTELVIADLETVSKRLDKTSKEAKTDKKAQADLLILNQFKNHLESGEIISKLDLNKEGLDLAKELNLLTAKKFIYVINVSEDQLMNRWMPDEKLKGVMGKSPSIIMCNKLELTLSDITLDEKKEFLAEFNLPESGLDNLIKTSYSTLDLLTFLTTGEDETRAWTAHTGDPIPQASRAIHTDFEKLFIRAEVINWKELLETGSYGGARAKGLIKTVGRDYVIQEGDVVEILIGK